MPLPPQSLIVLYNSGVIVFARRVASTSDTAEEISILFNKASDSGGRLGRGLRLLFVGRRPGGISQGRQDVGAPEEPRISKAEVLATCFGNVESWI
ncbi:MAG TPA: hypothetical protein VFZ27_05665 [Terriglobia bacterium]|nr:hypothetical protein [Terriglobia bacterium]